MAATLASRGIAARALLLAWLLASAHTALASGVDPLPSWKDGAARRAILEFLDAVTREGSPDFVPAPERIAVLDNDGTLWSERPLPFQLLFTFDRVRALAPQHPGWHTQQPFAAILANRPQDVQGGGHRTLLELLAVTHAGMTTDAFDALVREWLGSARHPTTGLPYTSMVFQPMLELLATLRARGFKTFIVSGGGVEFMRAFAETTYGIPPEQVIGSSGTLALEVRAGKPVLVKQAGVEQLTDGEEKPVAIQARIGRRPIAAFGNSDGDLAMVQWTMAGPGRRFALLVHHDDAQREFAYDRTDPLQKLDLALDEARAHGWTVVSMREDWRTIFPPERTTATQP